MTQKTKNYEFMQNKKCEFFPCHKVAETANFNCLFCFCPLYSFDDCGGNYTLTEKGLKNCENCALPHKRENYDYVINKLKKAGDNF